MPLRTLISIAALAVVGSACAQVGGDADVNTALINLRQQSNIFIQLQGTVTVGTTVKTIACDQFWTESTDSTGSPFIQSELLEYQNGGLIGRVVADGNTVWNYNLVAHEYQAGLYGRYTSGPPPLNYMSSALSILRSGANEFGSFTTKLLNQTYSGLQPNYQSWIPGATVTETPDPVVPNQVNVTYTLGTRRQATFHLLETNYTIELTSIDYQDISKLGSQQRIVRWTLTPYAVVPSTANYQPYAYNQIPGWRAVTSGN